MEWLKKIKDLENAINVSNVNGEDIKMMNVTLQLKVLKK